tara:strand:- start:228 stop:470 length:243 start_codon:yes stop_codon:yes gene_type:complete
MNKKKVIEDHYPNSLVVDGHDNAIIGVIDEKVLYDQEIIIQNLMKMDMSRDDALDYFFYNIKGAFMGQFTPVFAEIIKEK